jgi:hypothetical protein
MLRLAFGLVVGGGIVGYIGYQEYQVGADASATAVHCELADLENAGEPPDNHLQIREHWAIYPSWVGWGDAEGDRLDHVYYPIISEGHPYNQAWDQLLAQYGDAEIPETLHPQLTSLAVLVKTERFQRESDIPMEWQKVPSITGLLVHDIEKLKADEARLIQENFPGLSLENVMILEEGREPKSPMTAMAIMLLGAGLVVGGGVSFARSR